MSTDRIVTYQITVKGLLGPHWSDWFDGLEITSNQNDRDQYETTITGSLDRAALFGILVKAFNLNLELISVKQIQSQESLG
jgi:hypothetical protein